MGETLSGFFVPGESPSDHALLPYEFGHLQTILATKAACAGYPRTRARSRGSSDSCPSGVLSPPIIPLITTGHS